MCLLFSIHSTVPLSELLKRPTERSEKNKRRHRGQTHRVHRHNGKEVNLKPIVVQLVLFSFQLQVFDANKDGRLQLSEMAK